MKTFLTLLIIFFAFHPKAEAQDSEPRHLYWLYIVDGDTLYARTLPHVTVTATPIGKGKRIARRRDKLRYNVYKVYPYVLSTATYLDEIDSVYAIYGESTAFSNYKKIKEKQLIAKYKPIVQKMTYSQGKVIVLLINRESGRPCYDVIKELKGGFNAAVWQGVARLFDNNLKRTYQPMGRDRAIEDIVLDIQMGIPY